MGNIDKYLVRKIVYAYLQNQYYKEFIVIYLSHHRLERFNNELDKMFE